MLLALMMNQPWPLPADHPFYANVGRVASEWAHLEHSFDILIWKLAGVEMEKGACITAQMTGLASRCRAIISLGDHAGLSETLLKDFNKLMGKFNEVAQQRNRIVHDPWYLQPQTNNDQVGQFKSMAYKDNRFGVHTVIQSDVDETIEEILKLRRRAAELGERVFVELKAKAAE